MADLNRNRERRLVCLIGLLLAFGTLACYSPVRTFGFVNYDDTLYVYQERMVQQGLSWPGTRWAFQTFKAGNWNPLVWLSHMADCQLYGLTPGGHHITNVLLHTANVLLIFLILMRMTGAIWRSAFVAAIFAWHPLHVESVAWVSERKDVLSMLFWLLTIWSYARFTQAANAKRKGFYALALFLFALGLMCKPMLVTLPFVLLLLDYWPLQRAESLGRRVMEKLPFFVMSLAASALAIWAQKSENAFVAIPLPLRLENAAVSYVTYLGQLFWPVNLAVFYPHPHAIPMWETVGAILLLGAISWFVVRRMKQRCYLGVGWLWFLGTLLPVIGLLQVGGQALADRYTYIPYVGLAMMASWGLADLAEAWPRCRMGLASVAMLSLACCVAVTWSQLKYWHDSLSLFEHARKVTSENYIAEDKLGILWGRNGKFDVAEKHFLEARRLNPGVAETHHNLAQVYSAQHRLDEAMASSREALRLSPNAPECLNELAWFYATSPRANLRNGPEAVRLAERACNLTQQQDPNLLDTLAAAYAEAGRFDEAIKTATEVHNLALSSHEAATADSAQQRLELYRAGKAYRE